MFDCVHSRTAQTTTSSVSLWYSVDLLCISSNWLATERLDLWHNIHPYKDTETESGSGNTPAHKYWWEGFINMSNDRVLSAMMDDAGGKQSDRFLRLTVRLSPEQLLCVWPEGCGCISSLRECDVNPACTTNNITSCAEKSQLSSTSSTLILCVLSGCSSYHCGWGGLTHNYSVMSN